MKIALSSYSGYGAWFGLKLKAEGHDVDYLLSAEKYSPILEGLIPSKLISLDHRRNEVGFPKYSEYDLSIFDLTGRKHQADNSRMYCPTIGDGLLNCLLEDDRMAGIKLMEESGIAVPPYQEFTDISSARAFVKKTGRRYVFKPNGGQDQNAEATYVSKNAEDLLEYFDKLAVLSKGSKFILQEFISGVECSVEGWFNGSEFYALNATIEDKKFMNDDIGPNTGCSGNLVFLISSQCRLYEEGLKKAKKALAEVGYVGMIDLNTIITDTHAYGLEWTPRFGYDASATLACMYSGDWGQFLYDVAAMKTPIEGWKAAFGTSVRMSIPPYPTEMRLPKLKDVPIKGLDPEDKQQMLKTYLYDVKLNGNNKLHTAGINGLVCCPIEVAEGPVEAFDKLESKVKQFNIPDMQYRTDIRKTTLKRYYDLDLKGWF